MPGIIKIPPEQRYSSEPYNYNAAPPQLRKAAVEAFYYLLRNGFAVPEPPDSPQFSLNQVLRYNLTDRGWQWTQGFEPLPEDVNGYMKELRKLVPNLDAIIEQYIVESLNTFDRDLYFAAAVMVGAAAEKAIYLLSDALLMSIKDTARQNALRKLIEQRKLVALLGAVQSHIEAANKVIPYPIFEGSPTHLMSLFEAIRVQRNDAVHPMNAAVSPDAVRLSLRTFPYAMQKVEALRTWLDANPKSI